MNHEDDTQEIDMSKILGRPPGNVVQVDFSQKQRQEAKRHVMPVAISWLNRFEANSPWAMRLLAVMIILLLSLLMV